MWWARVRKAAFGPCQHATRRNGLGHGRRTAMRRTYLMLAAATAAAMVGCMATANAQDTVKIGWAIPKSGPGAPGAAITTLPNYQVWVKDVNDAGGLNVGGKKMKIEVIEYDDRSNSEELIKAV